MLRYYPHVQGGWMSVATVTRVAATSGETVPMNGRLFYWALTSALAGFLFGFDTVVISGAEQTIQSLWNLSPAVHGVALGAALYGTVVGSLIGRMAGRPVRPARHSTLGRRA